MEELKLTFTERKLTVTNTYYQVHVTLNKKQQISHFPYVWESWNSAQILL